MITLRQAFKKAFFESARILFLIIGAALVSLIVTRVHLVRQLVYFINIFTTETCVVLLLINTTLLIAGCFLDTTIRLILFMPILFL